MGQLGVVVIAQDVRQVLGRRRTGVDVRVGIDGPQSIKLGEQLLAKLLGHDSLSSQDHAGRRRQPNV